MGPLVESGGLVARRGPDPSSASSTVSTSDSLAIVRIRLTRSPSAVNRYATRSSPSSTIVIKPASREGRPSRPSAGRGMKETPGAVTPGPLHEWTRGLRPVVPRGRSTECPAVVAGGGPHGGTSPDRHESLNLAVPSVRTPRSDRASTGRRASVSRRVHRVMTVRHPTCSESQPRFENVGMKRYPRPGTVAMKRGCR